MPNKDMPPEKSTDTAAEEQDELLHVTIETEQETLDSEQTKVSTEANSVSAHPVDRGWAWMVLLGSILAMFVLGGVLRSSGLFFVQYQERFGSNASKTTVVLTMRMVCTSLTGVIVMTIGMNHMSARTTVCVGGILSSISYAASAYAENIETLIVFVGVLGGLGLTMTMLPSLSIVGIYFNKRRGLATSLVAASAPLGALVFGPLFTMLFAVYGYSGTMLIASGLLLNIVIAGCLMRPPEFYSTTVSERPSSSVVNDDIKRTLLNQPNRERTCDRRTTHTLYPTGEAGSDNAIDVKSDLLKDTFLKRSNDVLRERKSGVYDSPSLSKSCASAIYGVNNTYGFLKEKKLTNTSFSNVLGGSLPNMTCIEGIAASHTSLKTYPSTNVHSDTKSGFRRVLSGTLNILRQMFDMSVLKDPVFIHFSFFAITAFPSTVVTTVYLIPVAKDIGMNSERIGITMFVIGFSDLFGRVATGMIIDRKVLQPTTLIMISFVVLTVMNNILRLVRDFIALIAFVVIQASLSGIYMALYAVILVEYVGLARFKGALGFIHMFHGAAMAPLFPISGMLRDLSGAYYWTYHLMSVLQIAGAVLAFTLPITYRRYRQNSGTKSSDPS